MGSRQHLDIHADQGIAPHLQQNSCQEHMHRGGRLTVRIWQPGVKRNNGKLYRIGNEERRIGQQLEGKGVVLETQGVHIKGDLIAIKGHR